jgi:hypothetical protein
VDKSPTFLDGIKDAPNIIGIKKSGGSSARAIEHALLFPTHRSPRRKSP